MTALRTLVAAEMELRFRASDLAREHSPDSQAHAAKVLAMADAIKALALSPDIYAALVALDAKPVAA